MNTVYPRACGGTPEGQEQAPLTSGLSPRVRGNLGHVPPKVPRPGSIPARAGEPNVSRTGVPSNRVYPRACGGTRFRSVRRRRRVGLSPRVRGNPPCLCCRTIQPRSIPARAGEPGVDIQSIWVYRVYPRACGGTMIGPWATFCETGLSPRVRGNRVQHVGQKFVAGSIPARAGEPPAQSSPWPLATVYPRACGGTANAPTQIVGTLGSIPARAGEPPPPADLGGPQPVYPRACGGTRGSLPDVGQLPPGGSIPARAGEPNAEA